MNLSLSDVLFVGLIIMIVAGGLAGLGVVRDAVHDELRRRHLAQVLARVDDRHQGPLGSLVQAPARPIDPDPALGCGFCGPPFDCNADCTCATACGDGQCGALAWQAASNTEGWER